MSTGNGGGPLLRLTGVDTYYGPIHILQGLSMEVRAGELVCLLAATRPGSPRPSRRCSASLCS